MKNMKKILIIGVFLLAVFFVVLILFANAKAAKDAPALRTETAGQEKDSLFTDAEDWSEVFTLKATYPHDTDSFTEGLFFFNGGLCESTGLEGQSQLCLNIDPGSGVPETVKKIDDTEFGEGSTFFHGYLYLLTYQNGVAYRFDPDNLEASEAFEYPREGWGLTNDGVSLIASDGSSTLYFMDPGLKVTKELDVTYRGEKVENINELEYINGKIYANIWLESCIVIIDPETGEVESVISFESLLPDEEELRSADSVLNGIAYDESDATVYITGKNWPVMYHLEKK